MRRALSWVVLATLLPVTACGADDVEALPPCPKAISTGVAAPGLVGRIAFRTTGLPEPGFYHCSGIFVMNANGSDLRRLTREPETYPFGVQRSPVGGLYVFWGACPNVQHFELCLVDEDGTGRRPLSSGLGHVGPASDDDPTWSPDGSKILFRRRASSGGPGTTAGPGDLYIVGADGAGEERLTTDVPDESQPAWSPDGRTIAYIADDGTSQLRVMQATAGPSRVLVPGGTVNQSPAFSPDGRQVLFSSNRSNKAESAYVQWRRGYPGSEGLPVSPALDIYIVGVDGTGLQRITSDASSNFSPVWSPDGRHIAFISDRDDNYRPYVMATDGTNVVRLAPLEVESPNWFL